jgi:hypothetical protein
MPITFSSQDVKLASFPHTDAMVIIVHIDIWDVTKIFTDNGSHTKILFLATFDKLGFDRKQLQKSTKPLYGFGRKRIKPAGVITLVVSFVTPKNPHTEFITFDIVDMLYPYDAIFRRGLLNTFKRPYTRVTFASRHQKPSKLYLFLVVNKKPKTTRGVAHQAPKMHISCEKNQSGTIPPMFSTK